jgi:sugar phosphate isomerase/epimerase
MLVRNPIALASGVLVEFEAEAAIAAAAHAGFDAVGLWIEPEHWTASRIRSARAALRDSGLYAIDAEVLRMRPGPLSSAHHRMIEIAAEIGVHNILVVGAEGELPALTETFAHLCAIAEPRGIRMALEFMVFSAVKTLGAARSIVAAAKSPAAALLVDPLHLDRAGHSPSDVLALPATLLPYAQFCDATVSTITTGDDAALLQEARDGRAMPGTGALPLDALLRALPPATPLSVELRSKSLRDAFPNPVDRARAVFGATTEFLDSRTAA